MDFEGLVLGCFSFLMITIFVFYLIWKYELNRPYILKVIVLSALGHFLGGILYFYYSINVGADSVWYFQNATTTYMGTGYFFAFFILGYLKLLLVGDSLLGALLFFAALGYLGSVFYLLTFKILLDRLSDGNKYFLVDSNILFYPALLLLCWPSYFFWSAGLVKDSFAFLSISIFLFFFARGNLSPFNISLLILGSLMGFLVRPYLFIIVTNAGIIFVLFGSKWNIVIKFSILLIIAYITSIALPELEAFSSMVHFSVSGSGAGESVATYILRQQNYMSVGTSIPVPTQNPKLIFLFIPYLILANLCLPLFLGANNLIGMIGSVENTYLVFLIIFFLRNLQVWKFVREKIRLTRFFMLYFLVGMACLGVMSTNLGLAMREKMMYVPALLIIIMLIYSYKRILVVENWLTKNNLSS